MRTTRTGKILCDRSACQRLATFFYLSRDYGTEHTTRIYLCSICARKHQQGLSGAHLEPLSQQRR